MDMRLTSVVTPNPTSIANGGPLISFAAANAAELQRKAAQVFDAYGDPARGCPNAGGTCSVLVRGFDMAASASGDAFAVVVQAEHDSGFIASSPPAPLDDQIPLNAIQGTFPLGFAALQFFELSDPEELARTPRWSQNFWNDETTRKGTAGTSGYIYEVQIAGPFNRVWVAGILWGFYPAFT